METFNKISTDPLQSGSTINYEAHNFLDFFSFRNISVFDVPFLFLFYSIRFRYDYEETFQLLHPLIQWQTVKTEKNLTHIPHSVAKYFWSSFRFLFGYNSVANGKTLAYPYFFSLADFCFKYFFSFSLLLFFYNSQLNVPTVTIKNAKFFQSTCFHLSVLWWSNSRAKYMPKQRILKSRSRTTKKDIRISTLAANSIH